jgi:hypothetical protein
MNTREVYLRKLFDDLSLGRSIPPHRVITEGDYDIDDKSIESWLARQMGDMTCRYRYWYPDKIVTVQGWDNNTDSYSEHDVSYVEGVPDFTVNWNLLKTRALTLFPTQFVVFRFIDYTYGDGWEKWVLDGYGRGQRWLIMAFDDELMALQYKLSL